MKKYRLSIITLNGQYAREESHRTFRCREKALKKLDRFMVSTNIPLFLAYRVCLNRLKEPKWDKPLVKHCFHDELIASYQFEP